MSDLEALLSAVPIPKFFPVRQEFASTRLADVAQAVGAAITQAGVLSGTSINGRIAIGVGSRGIANLPVIVATVVEVVRAHGGDPFIVPAMGSHGGATAAGQTEVLAHLGVTDKSVNAPVRATMDVVQLGVSAGGLPLYVDRFAAGAAGIIAINRVKPHTNFHGPVESGLLKMLAIGFGKLAGANCAHARGFSHMGEHILDLSAAWAGRLPLLFGLAVIENAYQQTSKVVALPAAHIEEGERALLDEARALMPRIMFNPLHVLIVDEIGKDISGVGMDPNVTGRYPTENPVASPMTVARIAALRLSAATDGNAVGAGLADVVTRALESQVDRAKGYVNALTSTTMSTVKLPMVLPTDEYAVKAAIKTSHAPAGGLRAVRILSTKQLGQVWASEPLLAEARDQDGTEVIGPPRPLPFNVDGNLSP